MRGEANPYLRIGTTSNFPWTGFTSGFGTPYTIGNTKNAFNSGVGHMAGTLDSHRVESGSGHGPMLDASALGANASLFTSHAWLSSLSGSGASSSAMIDKPWYADLWGDIVGAKNWLFGKIGSIGDMIAKVGDSPLVQWVWQAVSGLPGQLWEKVKDQIGSMFAAVVGGNTLETGTGRVRDDVLAVANRYGWGTGAQWAGIDYIISHESNWNPKAQNPSSSASGLFQEIDSTWAATRPASAAAFAHAKDASNADQAQAGLRYISGGSRNFHDPVSAQQYWASHHYYDRGGWIPPGISTVWNATGRPEPVLTAAEHDSLLRWRGTNASARSADASSLIGHVSIHAGDGQRAGEIMDELWHRLRVARRGGVYPLVPVTVA
jgi:hypothetical protein